jgi:DNA-binding LytR/AlgR family response regulator
MTQAELRQHAPPAVALLPLLAGWGLAFATLSDVPAEHILVVGAVTTGSAAALTIPVWACGVRMAQRGRRLPHAAAAAVVAALLWVWLQFALNPFRVRPLVDAMLASRATMWQVMAGLWLFGSIVVLAQAKRAGAAPREAAAAGPAMPLERISIRLGDRTILVPAEGVERLQAADDYVAVFTGGRRLLASYRLADLAERLDRRWFVRVHRSHVVNLKFVESFERVDADRVRVRMRSGAIVPASRAGSAALRKLQAG